MDIDFTAEFKPCVLQQSSDVLTGQSRVQTATLEHTSSSSSSSSASSSSVARRKSSSGTNSAASPGVGATVMNIIRNAHVEICCITYYYTTTYAVDEHILIQIEVNFSTPLRHCSFAWLQLVQIPHFQLAVSVSHCTDTRTGTACVLLSTTALHCSAEQQAAAVVILANKC
jgi:hypothetical protein